MARILFLGEVVGRCGVRTLRKLLPNIRINNNIDYVIANGEGANSGYGINKTQATILTHNGVDLITGGEKLFYKLDMVDLINHASFVIRPINYLPKTPGKFCRNAIIKDKKYLFISLQGNAEMRQNLQNAFVSIDYFLDHLQEDVTPLIFFHASASAEKATMLHFLDGRVAAVIGTHTKVQTADEYITDKGTAFITDNGKIGALNSIGGLDVDTEIYKLRSQMPTRSKDTYGESLLQGVIVETDDSSGKATDIERLSVKTYIEEPLKDDKAV